MFRLIPFGLMFSMFMLVVPDSPGQPATSEPKDPKDEIKWPKEIGGKTLDQWVREMRSSPDASTRDQAIRTIPNFGPDSRKAASANLVNAILNERDVNVRLTAINTVPLIGFDEAYADQGLDAMVKILIPANAAASHTRFETTNSLGACGPIAKRAIPTLITYTMVDQTSWQNRKAAVAALGRLGMPMMKGEGPDVVAMRGIIKCLRTDSSHQVRREAISSLMTLGPPTVEAVWKELRDALVYVMKDPDKSISLWARVVYIRTEQELIKTNDPNLVAITKLLASKELDMKQEAIQAIGFIGEEAKSRLPELIAIAEGKNEEPFIIASALWAMSQMPSQTDKMLPVIDPLKRAPDPTIKAAANQAHRTLTEKPDPDKKIELPPKK